MLITHCHSPISHRGITLIVFVSTVKPCASELDYVRRKEYGLTRNVIFRKRCFRGVYSSDTNSRHTVSEVDSPWLGSRADILDLDDQCRRVSPSDTPDQVASCEPITLQVAEPFPVADLSKVIFGVATTLSRLQDSVSQFSHWMSGTGALFLAIVSMYDSHDMSLTAIRPWNCSFDVNEQHFAIIRDLVDYSTHDTQWAVIIDDDTFFPSPFSITQLLANHDPTVPTYIGGLTESPGAVEYFGVMAYGGADVFMSMPLMQQIDSHVEDCLAENLTREGDGLLSNCIQNYTQTDLTAIPGLYQLDMRGDLSGFYESGVFPLKCFLKRWRFDGDTVLANGYSISVYQDGISQEDMDLIEGTWEAAMGYEATMGKMRDKTEEGEKKSYRLIGAEEVDGNLRQVVLHHGVSDLDYDGEEEAMDEVVEIWWEWTRD
ncbi:glycosyltransferase family 31 protein [Trichoderma compactum]